MARPRPKNKDQEKKEWEGCNLKTTSGDWNMGMVNKSKYDKSENMTYHL
jgi:hypothetical protein